MTMVNRERMLRTFQTLVSIDSPSYGERSMGDHLKRQLAALGISPEEDGAGAAIGGNCGNIYGLLPGDESLPPLLFCTHMDTVEPGVGKRAVVGEDGVIRSGGDTVLGADDCAGTAAILEALRVIRERDLCHRPIEILFTAAEEAYSKGITQMDFSRIRSREAYVLDLTGPVGSAAYQAPSILSLAVSVRGRASHAGFAPEDGVHAIQAASDAVARLPMGKIDGETTCNIGVIRGGRATNIVPDLCELQGEIRSYSHARALELSEEVRRHFEDAARRFGAEADKPMLRRSGTRWCGASERSAKSSGFPFHSSGPSGAATTMCWQSRASPASSWQAPCRIVTPARSIRRRRISSGLRSLRSRS